MSVRTNRRINTRLRARHIAPSICSTGTADWHLQCQIVRIQHNNSAPRRSGSFLGARYCAPALPGPIAISIGSGAGLKLWIGQRHELYLLFANATEGTRRLVQSVFCRKQRVKSLSAAAVGQPTWTRPTSSDVLLHERVLTPRHILVQDIHRGFLKGSFPFGYLCSL